MVWSPVLEAIADYQVNEAMIVCTVLQAPVKRVLDHSISHINYMHC